MATGDGTSRSLRMPFSIRDLLPPADYAEPDDPSRPIGAFGLLLAEITPAVVGRILGSGAAAEARWLHLTGDVAACEAITTSVMLHHIVPLPEWKATNDLALSLSCASPGFGSVSGPDVPRGTRDGADAFALWGGG